MLDTMTFTKVMGAFCGALLVFLLGKWAAETLYQTGGPYGAEQAYVIDTGEGEDVAEAEPVEEVPFETIFASASAEDGERVFSRCRACHMLEDGSNGVGPHLYNVVGRNIDAVEGYDYSGALEQVAEVWTPENLYGFLENPRVWAPGNKMGFAGLSDSEDRADLIAYLATYAP